MIYNKTLKIGKMWCVRVVEEVEEQEKEKEGGGEGEGEEAKVCECDGGG